MGKYTKLIDSLFVNGKFQQDIYDEILKCDNRVIKYLTNSLLTAPDAHIRETCAELLSERECARAVPALIIALKDKVLYVRQDALWAIEKLCGFARGGLTDTLQITNMDKPQNLYDRVSEWWEANHRFIKNNELIW